MSDVLTQLIDGYTQVETAKINAGLKNTGQQQQQVMNTPTPNTNNQPQPVVTPGATPINWQHVLVYGGLGIGAILAITMILKG